MRLVCPECSAAYEAPDHLFGPQPRQVRCNRCGYQWTVIAAPSTTGTEAEASPVPPPALAPTPVPVPVAVAPPPEPPPPLPPEPVFVAPMVPSPEPVAMPQPVAEVIPPPVRTSGSSRLADALAGSRASAPVPELSTEDTLVAPFAPASTRKLFTGTTPADPAEMGPDPEERRLSAELDFGKVDRYDRERRGSGRIILVVVAAIIIAAVAAVIFKDNIVSMVPSTEAIYAAVGLK